jgi:glycosyltransferase involved in cell wall biosynthesis
MSIPSVRSESSALAGSRTPSKHPCRRSQRLGVYVDDIYRVVGGGEERRISVDRAFLLFACEVGRHFGSLVLFGRTLRSHRPADYTLPDGVELAELPHYSKLSHLGEVARATVGTVVGMWRGLSRVDIAWVLGPHPFSFFLILFAFLRRKRIVLGVRQDTLGYYHARLPSRAWTPVLALIWAMEGAYRLLARRIPTTVVGTDIAARYPARRSLLTMTVSLVRTADVVDTPRVRDWTGSITLLTVGRLEPEKNPLLLVDALALLNRDSPGRFRALWVGRGELEDATLHRAAELGISDAITLLGYVPLGPQLFELYQDAHIFVHVALTEGLPQVIIEALAAGTPVVATDVGGVAAGLDCGRAGLLVPPADLNALVAAVRRMADERELRQGLVLHGLQLARRHTLEQEAERVADFIAGDESSGQIARATSPSG